MRKFPIIRGDTPPSLKFFLREELSADEDVRPVRAVREGHEGEEWYHLRGLSYDPMAYVGRESGRGWEIV